MRAAKQKTEEGEGKGGECIDISLATSLLRLAAVMNVDGVKFTEVILTLTVPFRGLPAVTFVHLKRVTDFKLLSLPRSLPPLSHLPLYVFLSALSFIAFYPRASIFTVVGRSCS